MTFKIDYPSNLLDEICAPGYNEGLGFAAFNESGEKVTERDELYLAVMEKLAADAQSEKLALAPPVFIREYSEAYEKLLGGRQETTVGDLRRALAELPEDMPVKVSHQYDRHPLGVHDPICGACNVAAPVDLTPRDEGLRYFVIE